MVSAPCQPRICQQGDAVVVRAMPRTRIDALLVARGLFESRAKARAAIEAGGVTAAGVTVNRPSQMIEPDAAIEAAPAHPYVGRGALKLAHALAIWPIAVAGRTCLDVGASTGGFTEVLLQAGAARVYAVDVGRGQLHPRIAGDARVLSLEGVDARALTPALLAMPLQLVVCDVSFIALEKALPAALELAGPGADLVALVKPQFEVGRERVGKGGVVRDAGARDDAAAGVRRFLEASGWSVAGEAESPVLGGDGNAETLLWAQKR
jgi:23S rRNA (cytidine1920-2'-O)/16S rRNA (cytidine1409-2'-O)-methyltransferase